MSGPRSVAHAVIERAVSAFNRNPWTNERLVLFPRIDRLPYDSDGLLTVHNDSFRSDPGFRRAYARAVDAGGWDYRIEWRVHTILWAASTAAALDGAFVECGTARGFMASAVCEYLGWTDRPFYLFDTFEQEWVGADHASDYYATSFEGVQANFSQWPGVQLVQGRLPGTLSGTANGPVAFLHIDLNDPEPEEAVFRHFWPRLVDGGIVVFDDYAFHGYEASHESADRVAADLGVRILSLPTGQGLVVKVPTGSQP